MLWLPHCSEPVPDFETLMSWAEEGPRKLEISDETIFCDPKILKGVLHGKVCVCVCVCVLHNPVTSNFFYRDQ